MLEEEIRSLATAKNYAVLTTLFGDGRPSSQLVWIDADYDHLLVNTDLAHQKVKNVERDPRVAVAIIDADRPYKYVEVRGRVIDIIRGEAARSHLDAVSTRYTGSPYEREIRSERVILRIEPDRQRVGLRG